MNQRALAGGRTLVRAGLQPRTGRCEAKASRGLKPAFLFLSILVLAACGRKPDEVSANTGPPPAVVEPDMDASNFKVDRPEQFPLATAGERMATPELNVTGVVSPDVSRQRPVPSLASGRVVEIAARLGDEVMKGQLLFKVRSADVASAYRDYEQAVRNEKLAKTQLDRQQTLYDAGAVAKSLLEIAQTTEDNAKVDVENTLERLRVLGADPAHMSGIVEIDAPVSGVITDQQIADGAGVQALTPPNPFTISDTSHVWILCDVYENDLAKVRMDEYAEVRLNAYPDRVFKGRIGNIGQILDPNLHTAKVRLELENPGLMRFGMFVNATFHGDQAQRRATVPSTAILHLHDRDWVYTPAQEGHFKRVEVVAGDMLPNGMQEVTSGLKPGEKVVANALVLQSTVEQ
ncbi:MAG TPA: efflux RND transporter periplasmic adaptor subunit [Bryobacteraceae bacterium]|jgi:cobalt-zinc-cadmium efflux system membrane fusion protein